MCFFFDFMGAEDIIEGLNKHIEAVRRAKGIKTTGHLVLQKEITPHQSFKIYKVYKYTLWFTNGSKSCRVLTIHNIARVPDGHEEIILKDMDTRLSMSLFNWINSTSYDNVVSGEIKMQDIIYETT